MRPIVLSLLMLIPSAVAAQDSGILASADRLASEAAPAMTARVDTDQPTERTPPPAPPPRRRPSMVGYIGDSSIASQFRVRFDAGFEITAPDRAEFFYAKCGCYQGLPTDNPAYDPDAPGPAPGIAQDIDYQQLFVLGEFVLGSRTSVYGEIPFRWIDPQAFLPGLGSFGSAGGLSDIRGGLKVALATSDDHTVTVQLQADAPSGDSGKGLGTNHWTFSPTLLYLQRVGDRVAVESQFGSVHPIDGSAGIPTANSDSFAGTVLTYGAGASVNLASGDQVVAPVVEFVGWRVLSGFQTSTFGEADGINIVNLKIGVRVGAGRGSFYLGYGKALTDDVWYDDIIRAEYRFGF